MPFASKTILSVSILYDRLVDYPSRLTVTILHVLLIYTCAVNQCLMLFIVVRFYLSFGENTVLAQSNLSLHAFRL
jgi:hypothetical protein